VDAKLRDLFDWHLERVLAGLPKQLLAQLQQSPLHVEDTSPPRLKRVLAPALGLLGTFQLRSPLPSHDAQQADEATLHEHQEAAVNPVTLFRDQLLTAAAGERGYPTDASLRAELRRHLLHGIYHARSQQQASQLPIPVALPEEITAAARSAGRQSR